MIFLLFIISPFVACIAYTMSIWKMKTLSSKHIWTQAILLSLYMGVLGCTKELRGDFLDYHGYFLYVPKCGFVDYLLSFGKEPLYYAYTYVSYYLFGGNWNLFVVSFTSINYLLLSYAVITISKKINANIRTVITALYITMFFFQEFAASGNLVRQCLAQSLTVVFFVCYYIENKKKMWWIALCAVCVHSSCIPIIGLGLIPMIKEKFTIKSMTKILLILSICITVFYAAGDALSGVPFIGYIFSRATNSEQLLGQDSWQEEVGLTPVMLILLLMLSYMAISVYRTVNKGKITKEIIAMVNFNIILILSMFICNAIGAYYLLMRYFFFVYAFQCALITIYLSSTKLIQNNVVRPILIVTIIYYFFYNFTHNIFAYTSLGEAIFYPAPLHIF